MSLRLIFSCNQSWQTTMCRTFPDLRQLAIVIAAVASFLNMMSQSTLKTSRVACSRNASDPPFTIP
eukprot:2678732-Pyramimonas_sp.AAC.1